MERAYVYLVGNLVGFAVTSIGIGLALWLLIPWTWYARVMCVTVAILANAYAAHRLYPKFINRLIDLFRDDVP